MLCCLVLYIFNRSGDDEDDADDADDTGPAGDYDSLFAAYRRLIQLRDGQTSVSTGGAPTSQRHIHFHGKRVTTAPEVDLCVGSLLFNY